MARNSGRPSIPRLLFESLKHSITRAPKYLGLWLPFFLGSWVCMSVLGQLWNSMDGDVQAAMDLPFGMLEMLSGDLLLQMGFAVIAWGTVSDLAGEKDGFGQVMRRALSRLPTLFTFNLLGILLVALLLTLFNAFYFFDSVGATAMGLVFSLFTLFFFMFVAWAMVAVTFAPIVVLSGQSGVIACMKRSLSLAKGHIIYIGVTITSIYLLSEWIMILSPSYLEETNYFSNNYTLSSFGHIFLCQSIPSLLAGVTTGVLYFHLTNSKIYGANRAEL